MALPVKSDDEESRSRRGAGPRPFANITDARNQVNAPHAFRISRTLERRQSGFAGLRFVRAFVFPARPCRSFAQGRKAKG